MELVYPIYLDTPMMTAFLASLKGGVIEEASVESKTANSKQKSGKASVGAKISNLISAFVDANAQAELSGSLSENLESQYKGTVKFPEASLFIELRNLLVEQEIIKKINSHKEFNTVSIGDIVEIQGVTRPSPNYELRTAVSQLIPIIKPFLKFQEVQLENQLLNYDQYRTKNSKGQEIIKILDEQYDYKEIARGLQSQIKALQQQSSSMQELVSIIENLFPNETSTSLILDSDSFSSICRIFPSFARNGEIQEIFDADWRCVGKVIGKLNDKGEYNLFKRLPIGLFAKNVFSNLVEGFNNDELNISVSEPIIPGPALVVAVLAIFA